ncbi:hypothetical protein LYNGBM3L_16640 [Moorena producens 3L]|uniref:Uncharacterized protein n=1 Tax=Moorena producens 3L TaxID=489825 RepID=F4XS92_9CYAN|nr:hypothetical protein LYNGBM3L_16640 [Moorena producens 3L]
MENFSKLSLLKTPVLEAGDQNELKEEFKSSSYLDNQHNWR